MKGDWYGLDQLYVREQRDSIFWRVMVPSANPPSYLPFVKDVALHQQYDYIRKFYSQPPDEWFLSIPYHYLNEKTMNRIVDDCIEAILFVHEKVHSVEDLAGLKSSAGLLPEAMISPYEPPLGNTPPLPSPKSD